VLKKPKDRSVDNNLLAMNNKKHIIKLKGCFLQIIEHIGLYNCPLQITAHIRLYRVM
jgi:hypothetical protein